MWCLQKLWTPSEIIAWLVVLVLIVGIVLYCLLRELHEFLELPHLGFAIFLTGSFDGFYAVGDDSHHIVGMSDGGVRDILVTELRRIGKSLTSCGLDVALVSAVVFRRFGEIPTIN